MSALLTPALASRRMTRSWCCTRATTVLRLRCYRSAHSLAMNGLHGMRRFGDGGADTLVIYVYAHTGEAARNSCNPPCAGGAHVWPKAPTRGPISRVASPPFGVPPVLPASGFGVADVEYSDNLRYLLEFGVAPTDGCDYLVVVQTGRGVLSTHLPPLPPNVRAVQHPNECFDWGTFGWVSRGAGPSGAAWPGAVRVAAAFCSAAR